MTHFTMIHHLTTAPGATARADKFRSESNRQRLERILREMLAESRRKASPSMPSPARRIIE